jgi:hypothetical protein
VSGESSTGSAGIVRISGGASRAENGTGGQVSISSGSGFQGGNLLLSASGGSGGNGGKSRVTKIMICVFLLYNFLFA